LQANDRSGYAEDLRGATRLRAGWNPIYIAIIILVDSNVLPPKPWYTVISTLFLAGLTASLYRL